MAELKLAVRRIIGRLTRKPGFGRCCHCGTSWGNGSRDGYPLYFTQHSFLIFVCRWCWPRTTPQQRLGYLEWLLWECWAPHKSAESIDAIERAILPQLLDPASAVQEGGGS